MSKNQNGFSLIELMMVVVIIGVLAGVGVPQYQKFQMKAKQSEVKSLLSSMYTSQRAFHAEWNQYYGDFGAVGYGLEGQLGYLVGFRAPGINGPSDHPDVTNVQNKAPSVRNAQQYCNAAANACTFTKAKAAVGNLPASNTTANTFDFGGVANLDSDATFDQWVIDETRTFNHIRNDIAL